MNYVCPICAKEFNRDAALFLSHGEEHIIEQIKKQHPEWIENDGLCKKCYVYLKENLRPQDKQGK